MHLYMCPCHRSERTSFMPLLLAMSGLQFPGKHSSSCHRPLSLSFSSNPWVPKVDLHHRLITTADEDLWHLLKCLLLACTYLPGLTVKCWICRTSDGCWLCLGKLLNSILPCCCFSSIRQPNKKLEIGLQAIRLGSRSLCIVYHHHRCGFPVWLLWS